MRGQESLSRQDSTLEVVREALDLSTLTEW